MVKVVFAVWDNQFTRKAAEAVLEIFLGEEVKDVELNDHWIEGDEEARATRRHDEAFKQNSQIKSLFEFNTPLTNLFTWKRSECSL